MTVVTDSAGPDSKSDLTFGRVVVLGGAESYRAVPVPNHPELEIFLRGVWPGAGDLSDDALAGQLLNAVHAKDWTDRDGRFSVLVHHREKHRLSVVGDRFALVPIYRLEKDGTLYLSSTIQAFRDRGLADGSWNLEAFSEILAFNFPLDGKTLEQGVHALTTGQEWRIDTQTAQLTVHTAWDPAKILQRPRKTFEDMQDELIGRFWNGVKQLVAGHRHVGTTLSGGIDSRCLLAAAHGQSEQLSAYHVSVQGSRSEIYARQIAKMRDVPLTVLSVDASFAKGYYEKLQNIMRISEGMTFNSEAEGHYLRDHVDGPTVMLHGGFAELSKMESLRRYHVGEGLMSQNPGDVGAYLWPRWQRRFENRLNILSPDFRQQVQDAARDHLVGLCRGIAEKNPSLKPEDVVQCYFLKHAIAVERYSALIWNDRVPTHFPFASPAYVDALLEVRTEDRLEQHFQMAFLRTLAPELYDFPDANTGLHITAPAWRKKIHWFVEKVQVKLFQRKYLLEHGDFPAWMSNMVPSPEELLLQDVDGSRFDGEKLAEVVKRSKTSPSAGDVVEMLLMFDVIHSAGPPPRHRPAPNLV